ncbi:MAG: mandelate racemase/muconate lactonizing enzyme family protein, partial [Chloroflexota bacterium]|nr:mandelate racemase/muconate lactonizing enzyme family protein [Chloroflexota bacterium]
MRALGGLGEACWGVGVAELVHRADYVIVGEDPRNVGKLMEMTIRSLSGEGSIGSATVTAISGIELALWDLLARCLNTPISTLFGGRFREKAHICRLSQGRNPGPSEPAGSLHRGSRRSSSTWMSRTPYTRDISDSTYPRRHWIEPYNRTIGSTERRWMVSCVEAVREAVGPDVMLAMDCHRKFAVPDAIQLARALEPYDLMWLEDPVLPENIDGQKHVSDSTSIP